MVRESLLMMLPEFRGKWEKVKDRQTVRDIRDQLLISHNEYEKQYDRICSAFIGNSDEATLKNIFDFLKENVEYVEEPEKKQVIKSPAAIIESGECDCKCYASFTAGIVDALVRSGSDMEWCYVFAGYGETNHVFVEVEAEGKFFWVDPVLKKFNQREPVPITIRKICKDMALYKLSGVPDDKMGLVTEAVQTCIMPYESMDQQLARLTKCSPYGGGVLVPSGANDPVLYDLPFTGEVPLTAPVDAIPMFPGTPVTVNPEPYTEQPVTDNNTDTPTGVQTSANADPGIVNKDTGVGEWIKNNPWLAAAIVGGVVLVLANRKKRRGARG